MPPLGWSQLEGEALAFQPKHSLEIPLLFIALCSTLPTSSSGQECFAKDAKASNIPITTNSVFRCDHVHNQSSYAVVWIRFVDSYCCMSVLS